MIEMISLILSRPYDTYGCWYNNAYLVSSDHEWLNHTVSCNKFWINRVIFPPSPILSYHYPSGHLSGFGKSLGHRGWISQYHPHFDGARIQYLPRFDGAQIQCRHCVMEPMVWSTNCYESHPILQKKINAAIFDWVRWGLCRRESHFWYYSVH